MMWSMAHGSTRLGLQEHPSNLVPGGEPIRINPLRLILIGGAGRIYPTADHQGGEMVIPEILECCAASDAALLRLIVMLRQTTVPSMQLALILLQCRLVDTTGTPVPSCVPSFKV